MAAGARAPTLGVYLDGREAGERKLLSMSGRHSQIFQPIAVAGSDGGNAVQSLTAGHQVGTVVLPWPRQSFDLGLEPGGPESVPGRIVTKPDGHSGARDVDLRISAQVSDGIAGGGADIDMTTRAQV